LATPSTRRESAIDGKRSQKESEPDGILRGASAVVTEGESEAASAASEFTCSPSLLLIHQGENL